MVFLPLLIRINPHYLFLASQSSAWPSNRAPTLLEREVIKQRIGLSERRFSEYSSKLLEAKGWIAQLEDMMARETQERLILHASISPLNRTPREVLSLLFQVFVLDLLGSPWIVAQVSSSFREIALATSSVGPVPFSSHLH